MPVEGAYQCFSSDWQRTNPDLVLNLPKRAPRYAEHQDHVLVDYTPGGDLLAIWTMAYDESHADMSVFFARSSDNGKTWTDPSDIHPPDPNSGAVSTFGFPVVSRSGRIYCYYNRSVGVGETYLNAFIRCRYSDDDGHTWTDGDIDLEYRRTPIDHPDPTVLPQGIVWQKPIRDATGRHVVALTRWASQQVIPKRDPVGAGEVTPGMFREFRCEFLRFENIDDGPDPKEVRITWLPQDEQLITVPVRFEPEKSMGYTFCEEPGLVLLPDGRLFAEMRTANGQLWYTVSDDAEALTWRPTEILRNRDDGKPMLNPNAPSPMYLLEDGRYLLLLQNHDGFGYGGKGPLHLQSRRPQFMAVGEYRPKAHQPIWFSEPVLLFDTDRVGVHPLYMWWQSMYSSVTERDGVRIFWYTDRKVFALGKYITDAMLKPLTVPGSRNP